MKIGGKIKELRELRGWTQEQLAAKIDISEQRLSNWELKKNNPDKEILVLHILQYVFLRIKNALTLFGDVKV